MLHYGVKWSELITGSWRVRQPDRSAGSGDRQRLGNRFRYSYRRGARRRSRYPQHCASSQRSGNPPTPRKNKRRAPGERLTTPEPRDNGWCWTSRANLPLDREGRAGWRGGGGGGAGGGVGGVVPEPLLPGPRTVTVPGSHRFIRAFPCRLRRLWMRALRRRSQRARFSWRRLVRMTDILWSRVSIRHPWPNQRFAVKHPR